MWFPAEFSHNVFFSFEELNILLIKLTKYINKKLIPNWLVKFGIGVKTETGWQSSSYKGEKIIQAAQNQSTSIYPKDAYKGVRFEL